MIKIIVIILCLGLVGFGFCCGYGIGQEQARQEYESQIWWLTEKLSSFYKEVPGLYYLLECRQ